MPKGEPFRFYTSSVLVRLTGIKAVTLPELLEGIRRVNGSSIFQHTYHAFRERHFVPEVPQNDFAYWAGTVLRERVLAERLAAVDPYDYTDISSLRARFVEILEEHLRPGSGEGKAGEGQEFHFMEAISIVTPLPLEARDLPSFRDALAGISLRTLDYHFLEARLRLGKRTNDFSLWLAGSLGERDLALAFERIDFGLSTLENVRQQMLRLLVDRLARGKKRRWRWLRFLGGSALSGISGIMHFLKKGRGRARR